MKQRKILMILGTLIILSIILGTSYVFIKKPWIPESEPINKIIELDSIDEYGYVLEDRDTEIYKSTFKELQETLTKNEVDYKKYAELIAKLYIIDLYTIENKINKYDVGSLDFVYPDFKDNFSLKAQNTLYKYVEDNSYDKRSQDLPNVSQIQLSNIEDIKIKINKESFDGYKVTLTWEYENDLGYDNKATLELVQKENKIYVTKQDKAS